MDKFIYVFTEDARDRLLADGHEMIKKDDQNNIFIFINDGKMDFSLNEVSFISSDSLSF